MESTVAMIEAPMSALRDCRWQTVGDTLVVVADRARAVQLADTAGHLAVLLDLLAERAATAGQLVERLAGRGIDVGEDDVAAVLAALDALHLLQAAAPPDRAEGDRDFSNLAFLDMFATLAAPAEEYARRLRASHVLQLGTGGLGSNVLQSLCGLGVGRLTLVDDDVVEERNFARQFLYRESQLGQPKVERAADWVRAFHSGIDVRSVRRWVDRPEAVLDLLDGVDYVIAGIDQPREVDTWVNEACMRAGVPFTRGGMSGTDLLYYTVLPGCSACYGCRMLERDRVDAQLAAGRAGPDDVGGDLSRQLPRINRACGPAAALVGSLVAFEAMRVLTGYQAPVAAGAAVHISLYDGYSQHREEWTADPACELCAVARARVPAGV